MLQRYQWLGEQNAWQHDAHQVLDDADRVLSELILDTGSLTVALTNLSDGQFRVEVIEQLVTQPYAHEQTALQRPLNNAAMVRQVELRMHDTPVVFARSVVPLQLVNNDSTGLANLGQKPLGHLLFKDGNIRVSKRQYARLMASDGELFYARRTPYEYQGSAILVAEFFLPSLQQFVA